MPMFNMTDAANLKDADSGWTAGAYIDERIAAGILSREDVLSLMVTAHDEGWQEGYNAGVGDAEVR